VRALLFFSLLCCDRIKIRLRPSQTRPATFLFFLSLFVCLFVCICLQCLCLSLSSLHERQKTCPDLPPRRTQEGGGREHPLLMYSRKAFVNALFVSLCLWLSFEASTVFSCKQKKGRSHILFFFLACPSLNSLNVAKRETRRASDGEGRYYYAAALFNGSLSVSIFHLSYFILQASFCLSSCLNFPPNSHLNRRREITRSRVPCLSGAQALREGKIEFFLSSLNSAFSLEPLEESRTLSLSLSLSLCVCVCVCVCVSTCV